MDQSRRHFFGQAVGLTVVLAGTTILPATSFAKENAQIDTRTDERDAITQMGEAGFNNFVLLNKKNSKLYIIKDGEFFLETPVIIGRNRGGKNLTPSGVFSLTNIFQGATEPKMMFYHDATQAYLLHDVVRGREQALRVDSVTARQLSDGCVNVPAMPLSFVLAFARQQALVNPNGLATPLVIMDEKHSPLKFSKSVVGFAPQKYNPD